MTMLGYLQIGVERQNLENRDHSQWNLAEWIKVKKSDDFLEGACEKLSCPYVKHVKPSASSSNTNACEICRHKCTAW